VIDIPTSDMPSPRAGRTHLDSSKTPYLLGFRPLLERARVRKLTERSAKPTRRDVENPWNLFWGRS